MAGIDRKDGIDKSGIDRGQLLKRHHVRFSGSFGSKAMTIGAMVLASLSTVTLAGAQTPPEAPGSAASAAVFNYNLLGQVTATQLGTTEIGQVWEEVPIVDAVEPASTAKLAAPALPETQSSPTGPGFQYDLLGRTAATRVQPMAKEEPAIVLSRPTSDVATTENGLTRGHFSPDRVVPRPIPTAVAFGPVNSVTYADNSKDLDFLAQAPTQTSDQIQQRLTAYRGITNFGNIFRGSPGITISNPAGYGADDNTIFATATLQSRTRSTSQADGALGVGIGLLNAAETVGLELSYTLASFGNSRPFGAGGFNLKVHRALPDDFAIAVGWNGVITISDPFGDFKDSIYGVVTKVFRVNESLDDPFSRVAVSFGAGSGQFRSVDDIRNRRNTVNVFASGAVRIVDQASAIVEWTGQDLAIGFSILPIKDINWTITPAVRDIAGAGDGARFVLGTSLGIQF